jgi:branched-chain amino acid transport system substrate-binding protein
MKRIATLALIASLMLVGCGSRSECTDPLRCVAINSEEPITIAVALTLSGPDALYGIDALRGVEIAIADRGQLLNHPIQLVQEDDLCSAEGGQAAAERIAQNTDILGVIGATCSSASETAAKVLTEAGMVLISPSSSAASLTSAENHQAGFLRTIQNDEGQAKMVAEFAYMGLGARTMATIHNGHSYSDELQKKACAIFKGLGGQCVASYIIESGTDPSGALRHIALFKPEVLYYPLHIADGVAVTKQAVAAGLENTALIGSDRLLNTSFVSQTPAFSEGMYISGPSLSNIEPTFYEKYEARYGEKPIAVYAAQAYDATMMLFDAIVIAAKTTGGDINIPRQILLAALYATRDYKGLSGTLTCSSLGDCATPNVIIYQVRGLEFIPVYP